MPHSSPCIICDGCTVEYNEVHGTLSEIILQSSEFRGETQAYNHSTN